MFGFSIAGIAAKFAESFLGQKVKDGVGFAREIPRQVWEAIAVVGYALALYYTAHHALKQADKAGYNRARVEDAKALAELRTRAATVASAGKAIAQDTRSKNDAANVDIHRAAAAISVRGPGAASCRQLDHPTVPAASGGHEQPDRAGNAAVAQVPDRGGDDIIALPFADTVDYGEAHDRYRNEALSWRDWYRREFAEWVKLKDGNASQSPSK